MSAMTSPANAYTAPSISITTARTGASSKANALELLRHKGGQQQLMQQVDTAIANAEEKTD